LKVGQHLHILGHLIIRLLPLLSTAEGFHAFFLIFLAFRVRSFNNLLHCNLDLNRAEPKKTIVSFNLPDEVVVAVQEVQRAIGSDERLVH